MKTIRIHYFQHASFERLGFIEEWAKRNSFPISSTRFFENSFRLPKLDDFDWLVVMGGPMGVYDEKAFPWLSVEKELLLKAIQQGKTVIGICLGAQLIANVLGVKVYPNKYKEIGWLSIDKIPLSHLLVEDISDKNTVFHWHGDTFELPKYAIQIFRSEGCENQGFLYKDRVIGLQCHLEMTPTTIQAMIENCGEEIVEGKYTQTKEEIMENINHCATSNHILELILDGLKRKVLFN